MPYRDLRDEMNDVLDGLGVERSRVTGEGGYYGAWLPDQNRDDLRTQYVGVMYRSEVGYRSEVQKKLEEFVTTYFPEGDRATLIPNAEGFPILHISLKTLSHLKRLVGDRLMRKVARVTGPTTTSPYVPVLGAETTPGVFASHSPRDLEAFEMGMGAASAATEDCAKDLRKLRDDMMSLRKTFRAEALITKIFAEWLALAEEWEGRA